MVPPPVLEVGARRPTTTPEDASHFTPADFPGSFGLIAQPVIDRVLVVDGGANPIRWATFANPCH